MKRALILMLLWSAASTGLAEPATKVKEIHQQIKPGSSQEKQIALTLDACSGKFDADLIDYLIRNQIPATIFMTKRWINKNADGLGLIKAHLELFDVENHGEKHIPAVIGKDLTVYDIPVEVDVAHLKREVVEGGKAVEKAIGIAPHWYRGATAEYDEQAIKEIGKLGYKIAGFSLNADQGATLKKSAIEKRLKQAKAGDVIIAHMNKPASDTAEGLATGLDKLKQQGFVFVRLDKVELQEIADHPVTTEKKPKADQATPKPEAKEHKEAKPAPHKKSAKSSPSDSAKMNPPSGNPEK